MAGPYWGSIKSFNLEKGWGFIECADTHAVYGKDIFLAKRVVEGGVVNKGDQVSFTVDTDPSGQPAAVSVQVVSAAGAPAGGRVETFVGTVKSFNEMKGWGFIECAKTHARFGKDVFLSKRVIPGGTVSPGQQVRFSVELQASGAQATNVQLVQTGGAMRTFQGAVASPAAGGAGSFVGMVKSYNVEKGWGFIECAKTHAMYGKDIFLPKRALPTGVANAGERVSFSVNVEPTGAVATNVRVLSGGVGGQQMAYAGALGAFAHQPVYASGGYMGQIKVINEQKGFGMIKCDQTEQVYGKDVFFPRSILPVGLTVGSPVVFNFQMQDKGPSAFEIFPAQAMRSPSKGAGKVQMAPMMQYSMAPMMQAPVITERNKVYVGMVLKWNEEKGYGHIEHESLKAALGKDVFLMKSALGGATVESGTYVKFKCVSSPKGPQAEEVAVLPAGAVSAEGSPGTVFQGQLKSWNEQKGFGFIEGDAIKEAFGKDIFLHKRELSDWMPSVGDTVSFIVEVAKERGELVAKQVSAGGGQAYKAYGGAPNGRSLRASPY